MVKFIIIMLTQENYKLTALKQIRMVIGIILIQMVKLWQAANALTVSVSSLREKENKLKVMLLMMSEGFFVIMIRIVVTWFTTKSSL